MSIKKQKERAKKEGWLDWVRSDQDEAAMREGCYFSQETADMVVAFFETFLHHTMGEHSGDTFKLLDWQKEILLPLFGWKREDGTQRFKKAWVWTAKKQGKSTLSAGICVLYMMLFCGKRGELYGVAHTREQSGIIYREVAAMVNANETIQKKLKVLDSKKRILYPKTGTFYQALSGEANTRGVEGINPNLVLFDEIHAQRSRLLYDALAYASAARKNGLMLSVSTVGVADRSLIWWEAYEYTQKLIDGKITDPWTFGYLRQADEICHDDFEECGNPKQWAKAMPSLGHTVEAETIRQHYIEAKNSPAKQNAFKRYLLNIPTSAVDRVVPVHLWHAMEVEEQDMPDLTGRPAWAGLDMASHEDLSAFCVYLPPTNDDPRAWVLSECFVPRDKIREREKAGMAFYREWVNEGWLTECGKSRVDHFQIQQVILAACDQFDVQEIGFDPFGADGVVNELVDKHHVPLVAVSQGLKGMTPGTRQLLDDIAESKISHNGNKVMSWCLSNCAADDKSDGQIRFSKHKSADKIDLAVAFAMARGRHLAQSFVEESEPDLFF